MSTIRGEVHNTQFSGNDFALDDISLLATSGPTPGAPPRKETAEAQARSLIATARSDSPSAGHKVVQSASLGPLDGPALAAVLSMMPSSASSGMPPSPVDLERISGSAIALDDSWSGACDNLPGAILGGGDWPNWKPRGRRGSAHA